MALFSHHEPQHGALGRRSYATLASQNFSFTANVRWPYISAAVWQTRFCILFSIMSQKLIGVELYPKPNDIFQAVCRTMFTIYSFHIGSMYRYRSRLWFTHVQHVRLHKVQCVIWGGRLSLYSLRRLSLLQHMHTTLPKHIHLLFCGKCTSPVGCVNQVNQYYFSILLCLHFC